MKSVNLILFLLFLVTPTLAVDDFIVGSGYEVPLTGEAHDPGEPISFWQLQLIILFAYITSLPVEALVSFKSLTYLGYKSSLTKGNVLNNRIRSKIFDLIIENPGLHRNALLRKIGINRGTLRYHLGVLKDIELIKEHKDNGFIRYFKNHGEFDDKQQALLSALQKTTSRQIIDYLSRQPGASRDDIAKAIGIEPPTVSWHMKRLNEAGAINIDGNTYPKRYCLTDSVMIILQKDSNDTELFYTFPKQ